MSHKILDRLTIGAILVNAGLVAYGWFDHQHEHLLEYAHSALLTFFAVEIAMRLMSTRKPWRDGWLMADVLIVGLALMPLVGAGASILRVARLARMTHLLKHVAGLRIFRLVVRWDRG